MYLILAFIVWAKITYEYNSYSMRYNIVSRNHLSQEKIFFTHLNFNYDNDKYVHEE